MIKKTADGERKRYRESIEKQEENANGGQNEKVNLREKKYFEDRSRKREREQIGSGEKARERERE